MLAHGSINLQAKKKKICIHSRSQSNSSCRTWCYRVKQFLINIDHEHIFRVAEINARLVLIYVIQYNTMPRISKKLFTSNI